MKLFYTFLFMFVGISSYSQHAAYKQLRSPKDNISNDIQYWNKPYCASIMERVFSTHDLAHTMDRYKLKSKFLEEVIFYTAPHSPIYITVKFKKKRRLYIFCDVPGWEVDKFIPDGYESYSKKFNRYIMPYKCDCK